MKTRSMLNNSLWCLLFLLPIAVCPAANGRIIYVDDDGPADFSTIQAAIDDANDSDTILVAPGVYTGEGNRDIDFKGKAITVKSEEGPQTCIIDCQGSEDDFHRGFYFHNGEDANSVVQGLTIINGFVGEGGAILCKESSPTICECTIRSNSTKNCSDYDGNGGGIYCDSSKALIKDCIIIENSAIPVWVIVAVGGQGGGICCSNSNLTITGCEIASNISSPHGGGAVCCRMSDVTIDSCTFNNNQSTSIGIVSGNLDIKNCFIVKNQNDGIQSYRSNLKITGCMITENQGTGVICSSSNLKIADCMITENQGNGVYCSSSNEVIIKNCDISKNRYDGFGCHWGTNILIEQCLIAANKYMGIDCYTVDRLTVSNCTIVHNRIAGISCEDGSTNSSIRNSIIWENQIELDKRWLGNPLCTISYCNVQGALESVEITGDYPLNWGEGNINLDPNFVNPGYWDPNGTKWSGQDDIWIEGDYHLKSQAGRWDPNSQSWVQDDVTSPCIDAGDPLTAIGYEPYPNGYKINMGAFGGTQQTSMSIYDVNTFKPARAPNPDDGAVDVVLDIMPSWISDPNATMHDIYFGTSELPPFFRQQYQREFYPGALEPDTRYYWRIDDIDSLLNRAVGNIWTFTTGPQPTHAYNPYPPDGATEVSPEVILSWSPGKNAVSHDVYFGSTYPPPMFVRNQTETEFNPGQLRPQGMLYTQERCHWRIDEIDSQGNITTGDVWKFQVHEYKGRLCFIGETPVYINGELVPFSNVTKEQLNSGIAGHNMIEEIQEHEGTFVCYDVLLESGNCITVAENHIFMIEAGNWLSLHKLKAGMRLKTLNGIIGIINVKKKTNPYTGKVYNLKIAGSDQYMVGKDMIIVRDY